MKNRRTIDDSESDEAYCLTHSKRKDVDPSTTDSYSNNSNKINSRTGSSDEIDSSTTYLSKVESTVDVENENDNLSGHDSQSVDALLSLTEEYLKCNCHDESSTLTSLLTKCKDAICDLANKSNAQKAELCQYEDDNKCCSLKLHEEQIISADQQSKIHAMEVENASLACQLEQANKLRTDEQLRDDLKNARCCLEMRMEDNKRLEHELCHARKLLSDGDEANRELQCQISHTERTLENCEAQKTACIKNCDQLTNQLLNLRYELGTEKNANLEKVKKIDDFYRKVHNLESVTAGLQSEILLKEEKYAKLEAEKCALSQMCDEMKATVKCLHNDIDSLQREIRNAHIEIDCHRDHINTLNDENRCLRDKNKSLECDVETLEKQRQSDECKIEKLCLNIRKVEIELKEADERYDALTEEKNKIACETERVKEDVIKLCKHTKLMKNKELEMASKNDELVKACCALEADKCKLVESIDELNDELRCTRANEIEGEKKIMAKDTALSVAFKEIDNLKLNVKCYERTAEKERQRLLCVEQQLRDTELRQLNNEFMYGQNRECSKCIESVVTGTQLSSKYDEALLENEKCVYLIVVIT